jgi:hypothetical protein
MQRDEPRPPQRLLQPFAVARGGQEALDGFLQLAAEREMAQKRAPRDRRPTSGRSLSACSFRPPQGSRAVLKPQVVAVDTWKRSSTRSDCSRGCRAANKQLNFLIHILTILKPGGRTAVVVPDNIGPAK